MEKHVPSGNTLEGLLLTITTVFLWGGLALSLKIVSEQMDAYTICWFRFFVAFIFISLILKIKYKIGLYKLSLKLKGSYKLFILSFLGLALNYVFYVLSVGEISPGSTQVLLQLGGVFLTIGAVFIYKETFVMQQKIGFLAVLLGFIGFFYNKISDLIGNVDEYFLGISFGILSSITWAIYALAQKQLLSKFKSLELLALIFAACSLILFPLAKPLTIIELDGLQFYLLGFACMNTVVAYLCLTEAVNVWEASKVSGGIALTPLVSILVVESVAVYFPTYAVTESLNIVGYFGAGMIVSGSLLMTIIIKNK